MTRLVLAALLIAGLSSLMVSATPAAAQGGPALSITKCVVGPTNFTQCNPQLYVSPGDLVAYIICVTNNGPGTALGVVVTDMVQDFQSPDAGVTRTFVLGNIAVGATACTDPLFETISRSAVYGSSSNPANPINGQQIYDRATARGTNTDMFTSNNTLLEVSTPPTTAPPAPSTASFKAVAPTQLRICLGITTTRCFSLTP